MDFDHEFGRMPAFHIAESIDELTKEIGLMAYICWLEGEYRCEYVRKFADKVAAEYIANILVL